MGAKSTRSSQNKSPKSPTGKAGKTKMHGRVRITQRQRRQMRAEKEKADREESDSLMSDSLTEASDITHDSSMRMETNQDSESSSNQTTNGAVVTDETRNMIVDDCKSPEESLQKQFVREGSTMGSEDYKALADRKTKKVVFRSHKFAFLSEKSAKKNMELLRRSMNVDEKYFYGSVWKMVEKKVKTTMRTKRSSVLESLQRIVIGKKIIGWILLFCVGLLSRVTMLCGVIATDSEG